MLTEIKNLELIGQSTSLKQHGNLSEMLLAMDIKNDAFNNLNSKEYICALAPDDDDSGEGESE